MVCTRTIEKSEARNIQGIGQVIFPPFKVPLLGFKPDFKRF